MRTWSREQIEAANLAYHKYEAELYDDAHPEILAHEVTRWMNFFSMWRKDVKEKMTFVDVGAGTGFIEKIAEKFLTPEDQYIAVDLSPEMLDILSRKASRNLRTIMAPADKIPLENGMADLVLMNSVLHHLPDPLGFAAEAYRLLKPNGLLVVMHEPNIVFAKSWFMKNVARVASYTARWFRKRTSIVNKTHDQKLGICKKVSEDLLEKGLIDHELTDSQIQTMVDVHSPTASGHYEEVGFDCDFFLKSAEWKLDSYVTYNFLGKTDPGASVLHKIADSVIKIFRPKNGAFFSIVLRKP